MNRVITLLLIMLVPCLSMAQSDIPKTKPLKISAENNLDIKNSPKGSLLNMPSILDNKSKISIKDSINNRTIKMLPESELKQAGFDLEIDPKVGEAAKGKSGKHFGDMYLGDVKTGGKFIGIVCRDHEYVDGDRVRIFANGNLIEPNMYLTGSFKGINVNLEKGFNRLDFEALNQGSSGPNTAQVDVYDDQGQLIYSNKWLLSTGSKASLIIVKD